VGVKSEKGFSYVVKKELKKVPLFVPEKASKYTLGKKKKAADSPWGRAKGGSRVVVKDFKKKRGKQRRPTGASISKLQGTRDSKKGRARIRNYAKLKRERDQWRC